MIEEELIALYKKTKKQLASLMEDMTYSNFFRALQSGKRAYTVKNTQIQKSIDEEWINAIKECIPNLDAIVNNPRKYMKRETEVVPVEKARIVDSESVKHLASHTELISSVRGDEIRPNKILTAFNDESLELYENRFVMTLITRVSQFIDRRYFLLGTGGNEFSSSVLVDGTFEQAGESTDYSVKMAVHQGADYFDGGISSKIYEDLFMIRKYVTSFRYSPFMKVMSGAASVRPPIVNTNLLSKEPNYHACVKLWDFIESYDKIGYKIEITDSAPKLDRDFAEDFDAIDLLLYVALKKKMGEFDGRKRGMQKCEKRVLRPTFEEFETSNENLRAFDLPLGLKAALNGSGKRDTENAIKDVLLRAIRKEKIRSEMEEAEKREREKALEDVVKTALNKQRQLSEDERRERESRMTDAIRAALKVQRERERIEQNELRKTERRVENTLIRELERVKEDEREQRQREKREMRDNDALMGAILQDLLRIEDERQYIRMSPLVLEGGERLPVPVLGERLPATGELIERLEDYEKLLTPPPTLTDEDWEELRIAKTEGRRPRRKIGEDKLFDAIETALAEERKKQRREQARQKRLLQNGGAGEYNGFDASNGDTQFGETTQGNQTATDNNSAQSGNGENISDEQILDVLQNAERLLGDGADGNEPFKNDFESAQTSGHGNLAGGADELDEQNRRGGEETDEVTKGFWRRLFEILFLWWRKK